MDTKQNPKLIAWLTLARDTRFSALQKHQLLSHYFCPTKIYDKHYKDLCGALGIRTNSQKDNKFHASLENDLEQDLLWLGDDNHHLVCWGDHYYPCLLSQLSDPPICLFASGNLALLLEPKISVVGSRRPTPVGINLTRSISADLAKLGIVITSGMALGIDAVSHQAALAINEPTIAVMGCGLDIISPARHHSLFNKITQRGLALSEYPLGYPASKYTFPQRNRIVSGLSYGVVIVEAADKSGTLITARLAMEQNREVFVLPGSPANPQYCGSHRLIKQGASLVTDVEDILAALSSDLQSVLDADRKKEEIKSSIANKPDNHIDKHPILKHINYEPTAINQIISDSGLTASEVSSMLLILEVEGLVAAVNDSSYLRVC